MTELKCKICGRIRVYEGEKPTAKDKKDRCFLCGGVMVEVE